MSGYEKVSVIIYAKCIGSGVSTTLTITTDAGTKTLFIGRTLKPVLTVLDAGIDGMVTFTAGANLDIQKLMIYGGEITDMGPYTFSAPSLNDDDGFYSLIEGITPDKFYTVTGLPAGGCYFYRVKAIYVNDTESRWSNFCEVTLLEGVDIPGDVDGDGVVGMDDLTALIDYLVYGTEINMQNADVDGDGIVGMDDLTALINYLVNNHS